MFFVRVHMRMRTLTITLHEGIFYIRRGLRVVGSKIQGNATASKSGTGKCKFHAFFVSVCLLGDG